VSRLEEGLGDKAQFRQHIILGCLTCDDDSNSFW
jgi:hypothetical protein